jgi:hypothetical protein
MSAAHPAGSGQVLGYGVVLDHDGQARLLGRWQAEDDGDRSIYARPDERPLPAVRPYGEEELLASLGFVVADAIARLQFPAGGGPANAEELAGRYTRLVARALAGAEQVARGWQG